MATDREFSVILKATDLSTQPINQIVEALRKLTEAQKANNEAAAKGAITAKDFKDNLETAKSAAGGLAGAITVLQRVQDQMARTAKQGEALADMRAKLNAKQAETPPDAEPTEKQAVAVKRLEASVASLQKRYEQGNATLETYIATLEKMGVAADLSDKMGTRLLREREKTTQAAIAAQEKLNAKIAAAPEEGERTKAQEYSIRRLVTAMEAAQSRAQQAQVALQNYQGVKLNEAIITQQVRLREELTAVEPVIARANVETLSLTENRRKAAEAATAQAEAEKLLATQAKEAAEAEDKYNAEFAARQRAQRQAETSRFAKGGEVDVSSATAAAASEISLRNIRQSAFQDALRDQEAQMAAAKAARERDAAEDAAFVARKRAEAKATSAAQIEIDRSSAAAAAANELSLRNTRRSAFEEAVADQEQRVAAGKAAHAAEEADNKAFVERQRAEAKAASAAQIEIDKSSAAAAAANGLSLRNVRRAAFEEAIADHEQQQAATKSAREREAEEDAAFVARQRAQRQTETSRFTKGGEVDVSSAAAAAANELSLRNVRRSAFEEAIAEQEHRVAAEKAAHEEEDADNKAFVERQRAANKERIAADQKLLAEQQRINDERANMRRFDFQEAVAAQAKEEVLAQQRAAAAKEQQQRLEQLLESQNKIARAQAAIPGTLPSGAVPQAPRDFSQSITAILAPAQAARETLGGIEKQVDAIAVGMQAAKLRSEDYDKILRDLGATFGALQRQANLVEAFRQQEQAIERLLAELTKEQSTLQALNASYAKAQTYDEAQVRVILDQTNKVKGLTAAFNAQNETFSQTKAAAQAAGIDINNLAASETRITEAALRGSEVLRTANAATGRGNEFTFLGLRPYELQNLSYQINDVFTQLASGTSITQTLSQQGGQVFQLFQKQIVDTFITLKQIPFALTGIGVALSALTLVVLSFARALEEAAEKRKTLAALALDVDGVRYNADKLIASGEKLKKFGVDLGDAMQMVRELARAGVPQDDSLLGMDKTLEFAARLAQATGTKPLEAFKQVKTALLGTGDDLKKFATGLQNLLNIDQYKAIRDATEAGNLVEARTLLMTVAFDRVEKAADKALSEMGKDVISLKAAWDSLLKSIAENTLIRSVGVDLLNFLKSTVVEATKLAGILDGILHMDFAAIARAYRGLPPLERPQTVAETSPSPTGTVKVNTEGGGLGAVGMFQLRQAAAKDVGLTPEERYDYFKNVQGGLQYFRQQLEAFNGDLDAATRAFKEGAGGARAGKGFDYLKEVLGKDMAKVDPKVMADIREAFAGVFANYVNKADFPRIIQRIAQVALQESGAQHFVPGTEKPAGTVATTTAVGTNQQQIRSEDLRKAQEQQRRIESEAYATEEQRYKNFVSDLEEANKTAAAKVAKAFEGITVDPEVLKAANLQAIAQERLKVWQDYQTAKLQRAAETQAKLDAIEQQALQGDKTNADARLRLSDAEFERRRKALELENARGRFPTEGGQTYQQALDLLNASQQQAQANILIDAAKAIVENVTARREAELKEVRARLNLPGANPAEIAAAATAVVAKFAPLVVKAVDDANKTLERARPLASGEQTEAVRRALAENALTRAQAQRPESIGPLLQQATTGAETPVTAAVQQQAAQLAVITDSVKVAGVSAADAIGRITEFGKTSLASLRDLVATQRTQLEAIIAQPGTSDADKARLRTLIEQNALAPSKLAVELGTALQAAIAEDKQKLDKLLEEYKKATTDLDAKIRDSRLSPLAAAAERARIDQRLIPQISAAGRQVQQDVARGQTAAEQLGLSPGFRAGLAAEGQAAATQSNQQTLTSASARDAAQRTLEIGKTALATMSETIRTQQELLKAGATTQTEAENATREAHEAATKAVNDLEPAINKNIAALNEMGDNQGAKKLAADFKLLQTQVAYVDPLVQQITTGLEQSFTGRGLAAIESIAKAFGRIITGQEKFKDLLGDVGSAFANFTAGVLEDVAKIIIQYTLLKTIKDALGVGPGATAGGGWLASLFGSGAGAAAGAAAGTIGTTAASAGTISAETFLSAGSTGAFILHGGGVVGGSGMSRVVDLSVFRDAQRFHNGGMVLSRDEIPIIAQRGEKIVSLAQQRTDAAQKAAQAAQTAQNGASIRNVLAVGDKEIASAMNSSHGERVVLNVLQRNAPTVKKWVG